MIYNRIIPLSVSLTTLRAWLAESNFKYYRINVGQYPARLEVQGDEQDIVVLKLRFGI